MIEERFGASRSHARMLIARGSVSVNGRVVGLHELDMPEAELDGASIKVGKRQKPFEDDVAKLQLEV